jgi:predicted negative regulator of RcsB-dependent stress response
MTRRAESPSPLSRRRSARLALVYLKLQRYDDAMTAANRALERVYGPRRIRVLSTIVDIQLGKGDRAGARKTLEDAVTFADGLPEGQRNEEQVASLRRKLDAL